MHLFFILLIFRLNSYIFDYYYFFLMKYLFCLGLLFHVCGEAVVNVNSARADRQTDKENYIDFRLRLLGEPGDQIDMLINR